MTSPEQHQQPEEPRNSDTPEDNTWQSAAMSTDHTIRSAVDRVRPAGNRVGQWIVALLVRLRQWFAPLLNRVREWAEPRTRPLREKVAPYTKAAKHRLNSHAAQGQRPTRLRAMQAGVGIAAVGVVGLVIGTASTPSDNAQVEEAAQIASTQPDRTPEQAMAEARVAKPTDKEQSAAAKAQAGMDIPPNAEGIDVSNHNGDIDWNQVAESGKKFTFVLATDGESFTSPTFNEQYQGAKDAGLMAGAYHFGRPSGDAVSQADRMLQTTGGYQKDGRTLPPVLDLEVDPNSGGCYGKSSEEMHQWVEDFNGHVKQKTGKEPIIYASTSFWQTCMGNSDAFKDQPLWLASYGVDDPTVPGGWGEYDFWQYTESGSVPGMSGPVDLNRFQGSGEQLKELAR